MPSGIPLKYFPFPLDRPDLETQTSQDFRPECGCRFCIYSLETRSIHPQDQ